MAHGEREGRRAFLREAGGAIVAGTTGAWTARRAGASSAVQPAARETRRPLYAYVGCFTGKDRGARGEGISVFRVDRATGNWTQVQLLRDQVNPSYLVVDPARRFLFATHSDTELVSAFRIDSGTGQVTPLNQQSTGGRNPAHLALDPTGRFLLIANYAGGSVAVVPVLSDGSLGPRTDLVQVRGDLGPHRTEQATAHPHQCRFDRAGHFVAVPDKGLDRVFVFRLDPAAGTLRAAEPPSVATRSGAGPRHIDFHPTAPFAYVINELDSSVTSYRVDPERETLSPFQIVSSLPPSFVGNSTGAAIVVSPSGRSLYASNRGHDSLAVFAVSGNDGTLSPVGWVPSGGRTPRFFCLDPAGTTLYAANQATDTIVALRIDEATGMPAATGQVIATGTPTAIAFATLD